MKSRWFIALAAIIGLAMFPSLSIPVAAAAPTVKLVLGSTGATPWAVGNIAPGNSWTNTVTLSNTGSEDGVVTIWISDIVNGEGVNPEPETGDTAEPGELGDYLILDVSGADLSANFSLPAKINNFPQSTADARHLYVNQLKAFSTLNLQWEWQLPAETGNDVQGDILSFTINYMLEEFPPLPSPCPSPQVGITNTGSSSIFTGFTRSYILAVTNTGAVALSDVVVTDYLPELLSYKSSIPAASYVTGSQISWNLGTLDIGETKEIVAILGGVSSGTAVNIATVTTLEGAASTDSLSIMVLCSPGVHISLIDSSDPVAVGDEFTYTIRVLNQSESNSVHNMTIVGLIPGEAVYLNADGPTPSTIGCNAVRFGTVAVLTPGETVEFHIKVKAIAAGSAVFNATMGWDEFGEPVVSQEGTAIFMPGSPVPANCEVHNLTIGPIQAKPGESTSINYEVVNTGGQSGEFMVEISIPGLLQTSQLIKLEAGQTQAVSLMLPPGNPGTYQVDIGGVKDTFTIGPLPAVLSAPSGIQKVVSYWMIPFILAVIGAAALVYYLVIITMRSRRERLL